MHKAGLIDTIRPLIRGCLPRLLAELRLKFAGVVSSPGRNISPPREGFVGILWLCLGSSATASAESRFLPRFPNSSADQVAFVAGGNLWRVPKSGGHAMKLTDDPGQVLMPRFSPDGRSIAFTWRRAGTEDVYVIPVNGGEAKRLTFGPSRGNYDNIVASWTPDGTRIIFLSQRRARFAKQVAAFSVPREGGLADPLPFDHVGLLSFAPDGQSVAFDPTFRNLGGDKWKRYEGGQAPDIFTYDFRTQATRRMTDWKGIDTAPMWWRGRLYYLSDRDAHRRANIWVLDLENGSTRQVTNFTDFDVDIPSLGSNTISFQNGGQLYCIDLPSEALRRLDVDIRPDSRLKPRAVEPAAFLRRSDIAGQPDYTISPQGQSAIVVARGELFVVDAGSTRNLSHTPATDEDHPAISPDGLNVAYVSDGSGEQQVAMMPMSGGRERLLSHFKSGALYAPRWSPDSKKMVVADGNHRLWAVTVDGQLPTLISADPYAEIHDARFSPDSRWLAYSTVRPNQLRAIHIRNLESGTDTLVSSEMESDREPTFSSDGRYLFFISTRHELPIIADRDQETDIATLKSDGIYVATLQAATPLPFSPAPATIEPPVSKGAADPIQIELKGLMSRATLVPVVPGNISQLESRDGRLFYRSSAPSLIQGTLPGESSGLHVLEIDSGRDRTLIDAVDGYVLSANGTTALVERDNRIDKLMIGDTSVQPLVLKDVMLTVDPRREWREMFEQAWRLDRDLFWNPAMNGNDWQAVHDAYAKLLPLLGSHEDFMFLLGELQGELANSHMFIGQGDEGDKRTPAKTALLGADYALDAASGRYSMVHIYRGDGTRARFTAPLGRAGLDISEGTFLLAINGKELVAPEDPYSALVGSTGSVTLTVGATAQGPTRNIVVEPIASEILIRQHEWIEQNRGLVNRLSHGRAGYLFLSDFNEDGSEDFARQFYPQVDRPGLIIDVRWNGGGFTSQWMLGILRRRLVGAFLNREGASTTLPGSVPPAAMAVITNRFSASDGDQFPYYFREYGLGKIVGSRTWGGVRGIKGPWTLMDGTYVTVPKDALYSPSAGWVIENQGTEPDIDIADTPTYAADGSDIQLAAALRNITEALDKTAPAVLHPPPLVPSYPAPGAPPPASFGAHSSLPAGH